MVDPYKLSRPHVALVGMAQTSRNKAPWDDPEAEIWGINESYHPKNVSPKSTWAKKDAPEPYMKRWDRWFQLHPKWDYMRLGNFNHENHPLWLTNRVGPCLLCGGHGKIAQPGGDGVLCKDCGGTGRYDPASHRRTLDFPIYLQSPDPDIPGSFLYPLDEILEPYGLNKGHVRYHTNSMTYMLAFAMHIGAGTLKKVSVWGFEMASATEYADQKPSAEFWLGILIGRAKYEGIELELPEHCALLGGTAPLYAFEKTPGLTSMHAEIRVNAINQALQKAQAELNHIRGAKNLLASKIKNTKGLSKPGLEKLQRELMELQQGEFDKVCEANSLFGALQEAKHTQGEVKQSRTQEFIGYLSGSGNVKKVDLSQFEREAAMSAQAGEDRSDEVNIFREEA